jgi:tRNA(Ile)-lysidine synthase
MQRLRPRRVGSFARKLLIEWKHLKLPLAEWRAVVAVSGGADSTALLLALDELVRAERLELKLTVAHLNHGLRGEESEGDARWVAELSKKLGYDISLDEVNVRERAKVSRDNLEQAARRARYEFLADVAARVEACAVLTAHTLDDQAETVLLRLMRGSGLEGLGGMEAVRVLDEKRNIKLVRPLLGWARRAETVAYCEARGVAFRSDAMNEDEAFARVRVRRQLFPLLKTFNVRVVEALARTARLLRDDAEALQAEARGLLKAASVESTSGQPSLCVNMLAKAHASVRRRALRLWLAHARGDLRRLELVHLLGVEKLVFGERGGRVAELPGGCRVERRKTYLLFHQSEED